MVDLQWLSIPILFRYLPVFTGNVYPFVYHLKIFFRKTTTASSLLHTIVKIKEEIV